MAHQELEEPAYDCGSLFSSQSHREGEAVGFTPGGALDLTTGWDFRKKSHQQAALRLIRDQQPVLVILSPPCTTFSPLRFLSNHKRNPEVVAEEEDEGLEHVRFSGLIAKIQHRGGRGFLFEHPGCNFLEDIGTSGTARTSRCLCGPSRFMQIRVENYKGTPSTEAYTSSHQCGGAGKHPEPQMRDITPNINRCFLARPARSEVHPCLRRCNPSRTTTACTSLGEIQQSCSRLLGDHGHLGHPASSSSSTSALCAHWCCRLSSGCCQHLISQKYNYENPQGPSANHSRQLANHCDAPPIYEIRVDRDYILSCPRVNFTSQ